MKYPKHRKSPARHVVKSHTRKGRPVRSFVRGKEKRKLTKKQKFVGVTIRRQTATKTISDEEIKTKIRTLCSLSRKELGYCPKQVTIVLYRSWSKIPAQVIYPDRDKIVIELAISDLTHANIGEGLLSLGHEFMEGVVRIKDVKRGGKGAWEPAHNKANMLRKKIFKAIVSKEMVKWDGEDYYVGKDGYKEVIPKSWMKN